MNYGQFLNMIPEATLMAILVVVFIVDFIFSSKDSRKHSALYLTTAVLLLGQCAVCAVAGPSDAFDGMYVSTASVNIMKLILTAGTLVVVIMSQSWLRLQEVNNKDGEFYMLVISTLLGMYMMMSAGHFIMFFLGLAPMWASNVINDAVGPILDVIMK